MRVSWRNLVTRPGETACVSALNTGPSSRRHPAVQSDVVIARAPDRTVPGTTASSEILLRSTTAFGTRRRAVAVEVLWDGGEVEGLGTLARTARTTSRASGRP